MVFLSVCVALYQYVPRDDGELAIEEGELVYILEKSTEDDWWKATKKASGGERDDPIGLIPQTYVEEASIEHNSLRDSANTELARPNQHTALRRFMITLDRPMRSSPFQKIQRLPCSIPPIPTGRLSASMVNMGLYQQTTLKLRGTLGHRAQLLTTHSKQWPLISQ